MGMQPTKPNAELLDFLEDAEAEIRRQEQLGNKPLVGLKRVQDVKRGLYWSDKRSDDLLSDGIIIGFLLGITARGSESEQIERAKKFYQRGRNKKNRAPGEKGPGRKISEITKAMTILSTKIPPPVPYIYDRKAFIADLIAHYDYLKELIRPVKRNAAAILPIKSGSKSVSIEYALTKLKNIAKHNSERQTSL
jgi:hypothetical protein